LLREGESQVQHHKKKKTYQQHFRATSARVVRAQRIRYLAEHLLVLVSLFAALLLTKSPFMGCELVD